MLFSVDGDSGVIEDVSEGELAEMGFLERQDLQEWVIDEPRILGEELLIVTSEFANFEDTRNRLDILREEWLLEEGDHVYFDPDKVPTDAPQG